MNTIVYQFKELLTTLKQFVEQEYEGIKKIDPLFSLDASFQNGKTEKNSNPQVSVNQSVTTQQAPSKAIEKDLSSSLHVKIKEENNLESKLETRLTDKPKETQSIEDAHIQEGFIRLEPLGKAIEDSFGDIKNVMRQLFPNFVTLDRILDDSKAKLIKNKWKQEEVIEPVIIIANQETGLELAFLNAIANALNIYGIKASVIFASKYEKKGWQTIIDNPKIKGIIAKEQFIEYSQLKNYYKESVKDGFCYLKDIALFQLTDFSLYFKEPKLKALLWKSLQTRLKA